MSATERATLLADLSEVFRNRLGLSELGDLEESTRFFADLGLASIDAVVLGEALRARYGPSLPFGELMSTLGRREDRDLTIGELADFLRTHGH